MPRSKRLVSLSVGLLFCSGSVAAFAASARLDQGSTIQVQIERDTSMKVGRPVRGKVVYPVYVDNQLLVPAGAEIAGKISSLSRVSKHKRMNAELGGDFTPLHEARVEFDQLRLSDGTVMPIRAMTSGNGVEVVRFIAPSSSEHKSLMKKLWADAVGREKETVRTFTAPGKKDRARRALYSELPYHPELLEAGTEYTVRLEQPLSVQVGSIAKNEPKDIEASTKLEAALLDEVSSKKTIHGTKVRAIVTEPLFDKNQQVQVPQGSMLLGEVTQAKPAGKWGKGGTLRFSFRELKFPAGFTQRVHGAPVAVDSDRNANLAVDAEGGVKPGPKGIGIPLAMGLLAVSAVHEDEASVLHTGGASNGFALVGRLAALASKSAYVGAAFGFYGTGRAVYSRYLRRGDDVTFPKNTRIEVVLSPERANRLKPAQ